MGFYSEGPLAQKTARDLRLPLGVGLPTLLLASARAMNAERFADVGHDGRRSRRALRSHAAGSVNQGAVTTSCPLMLG